MNPRDPVDHRFTVVGDSRHDLPLFGIFSCARKDGELKCEHPNPKDVYDAGRILQEHHGNMYKLRRALFQLKILVPIGFLLISLRIWFLMNFTG